MELSLRIMLIVVFVAFTGHRGYYSRKLQPSATETIEEKQGGFATRIAGLLAIVGLVSLIAYTAVPRLLSWAPLPLPTWLRWGGVAMALGGFILLQWAHVALGRNWSDTPRITTRQELVMEGPYRWIRHPIYTAFLLILGSPLLIAANWILGGAWLGMAALDIFSRIRYEEDRLRIRFGNEYHNYKKRTGALLPRI